SCRALSRLAPALRPAPPVAHEPRPSFPPRRPSDLRAAALGRLSFTTDIADLSDRQLVIEAASENEEIKKTIFDDELPVEQIGDRSEEHTSGLQARFDRVCRLRGEEKKKERRTDAKS